MTNTLLGTFVFVGSTNPGTAVVDILYSPPGGLPSITVPYTTEVIRLTFDPASPTSAEANTSDVTVINATGIRAGGTYSASGFVDGGTGGTFDTSSLLTSGEFSFSGATSSGTVSIDITYTSPLGTSITKTYSIVVSSLVFSPPPPLGVIGVEGGSAPFTVTVIGGAPDGFISITSQIGGVLAVLFQ